MQRNTFLDFLDLLTYTVITDTHAFHIKTNIFNETDILPWYKMDTFIGALVSGEENQDYIQILQLTHIFVRDLWQIRSLK